jgi:hypothetical protein
MLLSVPGLSGIEPPGLDVGPQHVPGDRRQGVTAAMALLVCCPNLTGGL